MGLTKVFVGNLSFKTRDSDLASEFSSAGKVVSANIITRGPRSLGYGFVELESEEEAQKAVALMNKKNIDSREINVELARPRDEAKLAERRNNPEFQGGGQRGGRGGVGGGEGEEGAGGGGGNFGRGRGYGRRGRGGGRGRGRGNFGRGARRYRPRGQSDDPSGAGGGSGVVDVGGDPSFNDNNPGVPYPRGRGGRGRGRGRGGRGRGRGRGGYSNRPLVPREPSKTTLYVANLPFSAEDSVLADLFKDLKPTKSYVVKARNGRSKGFGFVEFANEEDQKAALAAAEKFSISERNLIVKIALTENRINNEENDNNNQGQNTSEAPQSNEKEPNVQQKNNENQASS